ncbi:response regulator [Peribacillus castrilensis]|uniref:Response regulator n=2 Tax=Peribacillus TaxID=2675229 RepID=A0AAJ1QQI1_9BACI|nr:MULTISPECIES: response regulator [Bacillaceae]MCD1158834.1 response regulator [Peribacillus castrilensis]MCP1095236.1 response regulator [Bacillaceae bacterium OS4b]QYF84405.1 response regulator [Brevibacterium sp. PAMC21349]MBD8587656.1 response regulator [Peribacillus simplex]MCF7624086.1 response regulator [Peribacillus frigoritolerans]
MQKIRAVIAEDDFRVADIHEKFLKNFDEIEVVGKAVNAKKTLRILEQKSPDLLLLDVYMPDQLGTDLLPDIRKKFPNVDIIMITAATDKEQLEKALHYGVENYLIKPVEMKRFNQVIEEYLKKVHLMKSKQEIDQDFVDLILKKGSSVLESNDGQDLPKGVDEITLAKVIEVLEASDIGLSAEQVSGQIGASRTTARRYLEYLISVKKCKAEVVYGVVGRPERRYYKIQ